MAGKPVGPVCPGEVLEDTGEFIRRKVEAPFQNVAENAESIGSTASEVWNATAPERNWIGGRASDFWKKYGSSLGKAYEFAGKNQEACKDGGLAGGAGGFALGSVVPVIGSTAGTILGGVGGCAGTVGIKTGIEKPLTVI